MGVRPAAVARVVARAEAAGRPQGAVRDRVEVPDRDGVAGCARALWSVDHAAHAISQVGGGRHIRPDACGPRRRRRTRWETSSGWCRSILRSSALTSMRPGPKKKGLRDPALGRSRGGLTSKIHLACHGRGRPLAFGVTGGNTNDCTRLITVMDAIRVPRLGPGRPRVRPDYVLAPRASSRAIRSWLRHHGIPHTIPDRADQVRNRAGRATPGGRPPTFDHQAYATSWNGASLLPRDLGDTRAGCLNG